MTSKFRHVLFLLIILIAACFSSSKTNKKGSGDLFGYADQSKENQNGDIAYYLPPEDGGGGITVPPGTNSSEVCDEPVTIVSSELTEAKAGEEYNFDLLVQGGCGQFTCALLEAPEWLELNGCQLVGTPDAIGEYPVKVKVGEEEKTFTLSARDNPQIIMWSGSVYLLWEVGAKPANDPSDQFEITQGKQAIYAQVSGFANSYNVTLFDPKFSLISLGNNLYQLKPNDGVLPADQEEVVVNDIELSAANEFNDFVSRNFDVTVYRDPCDHPLKIKPWKIFKEDGTSFADISDQVRSNKKKKIEVSSGDSNIDVDLGTKYHIIFKADGAEGPYQWSFAGKVGPKLYPGPECDFFDFSLDLPLAGEVDFGPPSCSDNLLTTNEKWEVVALDDKDISQEDIDNNVYFKLTTDFSFKGKVLPYSAAFDYLVYDQLEVTAETSACHTETSLKEKATYSLNHILKLPDEGVEKIQCEQAINYIFDDVKSRSRLWVHFKNDDELAKDKLVASIEYEVDECLKDLSQCKKPASPNENFGTRSGFVNEITRIEMEFYDGYAGTASHCCPQLDYDLVSLTCYTPYRIFHYYDGKDNDYDGEDERDENPGIDWNVVPRGNLPEDSHDNVITATRRTYDLTPNPLPTESIWLPKSKPDYPSD